MYSNNLVSAEMKTDMFFPALHSAMFTVFQLQKKEVHNFQ